MTVNVILKRNKSKTQGLGKSRSMTQAGGHRNASPSQARIGGGHRDASPSQVRIGGGHPSHHPNKATSSHRFLSVEPSSTSIRRSVNGPPVIQNLDDEVEEGGKRELLKQIFIGWFAVYSIICLVFIVGTILIWTFVSYYDLKYFIHRQSGTPFFHVETGSTWMATKYLMGSVTHLVLSWIATSVLVGGRWSQKMIERSLDRIKIFFWLGVVAVVGEAFMIDASLHYLISIPIVQNGGFRETILPPAPPATISNCVKPTAVMEDESSNPGILFVRMNLKWFIEVLCYEESHTSTPRWENYFLESMADPEGHNVSQPCKSHLAKLRDAGKYDCEKAALLYHAIMIWIALSILGIFFACTLFYLNHRLTVKLSPVPRYSFGDLTAFEAADLEHLRSVADKVRHMGSKKKFLEVPSDNRINTSVDGGHKNSFSHRKS